MNKTKQPSPRSSHARKPLVNITNIANNTNISNIKSYGSVDSKQKNNVELNLNVEKDRKLKSYHSSSRCETPVERIRSKKNSTLGR